MPLRAKERELGLAYLLAALAAIFIIAAVGLGAPQLPTAWPHLPTPTELELLVRSPDRDQLAGALALLTWAVWLSWGYVSTTTLLRMMVVAAERLARGAAWVRSFRSFSDFLTLTPIRRTVDASLAGVLFLRIATGTTAHAQEPVVPPPTEQVQVRADVQPPPIDIRSPITAHRQVARFPAELFSAAALAATGPHHTDHLRFAPDLRSGDVLYRVKPGDTLSRIAQLFYGRGRIDDYKLIYDANVGRPQPDGRTFTTAGQIWPGWLLVIPNPREAGIETDADGQRWFTVRAGDSLAAICARVLGDENRWPELFALNQGAWLADGHTLVRPEVIWPGLRLRLPMDEVPNTPEPADEPEPAEQPQTPVVPATEAPSPHPTVGPVPQVATAPQVAMPMPQVAPPTAVPAPVAAAPTPTPVPTELVSKTPTVAAPAAAASPVSAAPSWAQLHWDLLNRDASWPLPLGGVLLGAGLLLAGRRLRRRPAPSSRFETSVEITDGFARAVGGDEASYELPLTSLAEQILHVARPHGCPSLCLHAAAAGRTRATLFFGVNSEEAEALQTAAATMSTRPDSVRLTTLPEGTVRWDQDWSTVRPGSVADAPDRPAVQLFPMGLTNDRRVLYGDRDRGPILVAGLSSAGIWTLLSALVVDRLRRQPPRGLAVIAIARGDRLDPLLADAPQLRAAFVDPSDRMAVNWVLADINLELDHRLEAGTADRPDVVLVVDEWAEIADAGPTVELLARHGASVGVHLIAATTQVDNSAVQRWVGLFGTRLVLQTPDASASARLLGQAGAEDLDRVGQALPFVNGELLPRIRGFCVPPLHIQHLVDRMRAQVEQATSPSLFDDGLGPAQQHSATGDDDAAGQESGQQHEPAAAAIVDETVNGPVAAAYQQVPLMAAVPMAPRPASAPTAVSSVPAPPIVVELLGQDRITVGGQELVPTDGVVWELFRIVSCLPPGKASLARVAALQYPSDADRKAAIQRLRQNKSNLQKSWTSVLGDDAKRLLTVDGGVLSLAADLVRVDVHVFLTEVFDANRARKEDQLDRAIAAYRRARELYVGPLLAGRDEDFEWLSLPVEGALTLREAYRHQERVATQHLAELLVINGQTDEATSLYADLMRDPGPPDVEADELEQFVFRQYEFREECARALFECCRLSGDLPGLQRGYQELQDVLRALGADAGVPMGADGTEPGAVTQARYAQIYAELTRNAAAASN